MKNRGNDLPTLQDVADAAKVSTATVSRCLNNPEQVTEDTRRRVMDAVDRLGYSPNFGARALAAKRTNTFGAIIPTMDNAIFARGLQAFQEALEKEHATMLVASSSYDAETEIRQIRNLVARGADGLFLIGNDRNPEIYGFLERQNVPVVIAWAISSETSRASVGFDNVKASYDLASSALQMGHRQVGCISAHTAQNDRARDRVSGIRKAAADAGLDSGCLSIFETNYSVESGYRAFNRMIEERPELSLIMCGNDVLAVGAIKAAIERGLSVPGDISITGFDDIEIASVVTPSLTTVHVPHRQMGRMAAELLLNQAHGRNGQKQIVLNTKIVMRESLGSPGI